MSSHVKFTFGSSFDAAAEEEVVSEPAHEIIAKELRAEFDQEVTQERQKAYDEGYQAGEKAALDRIEADLAKTLNEIVTQSSELTRQFELRTEEVFSQAVELALIVAKQIAAELIAQEPLKIMEMMFRDTINFIRDEPVVLIQVPADLMSEAELRVRTAADEYGFSGRISVKANEGMRRGDWQFEWANGGVIKNNDEVARTVSEAVRSYMLARPAGSLPGSIHGQGEQEGEQV